MESDDLKEEILNKLQMSLAKQLEPEQVRMVCSVAGMVLNPYTITKTETALSTEVIRPNEEFVKQFVAIKTVNGCSRRTLKYYQTVLEHFFQVVKKPLETIATNDIRAYLAIREQRDGCTKSTQDNERRVLSSFFQTALCEEWITKKPNVENSQNQNCEKEPAAILRDGAGGNPQGCKKEPPKATAQIPDDC